MEYLQNKKKVLTEQYYASLMDQNKKLYLARKKLRFGNA